jgi:sugar lactone lactonase YvrE
MRVTERWLRAIAGLGASLLGCGGDDRCDPDAADTICTIAGSGEQSFGGDGGPATEAALYIPVDMTVAPDGEVWILDFNNYLVRAIDAAGTIRTVLGNGLVGDSPPMGVERVPALEAVFNHASDLVSRGDYLYLAAWHNSRIKRIRLSDMTLENFAGRGRRTYYDGDGGPALEASLDLPAAIAFAPDGNLTIMDQSNQVIRQVDGDGLIHTIVGRCIVDLDAPCSPGQQPVACPGSNKLTCGDPAMTCDHACNPGFTGDGGPALEARMAQPYGAAAEPAGRIAYDGAGNLIFVDSANHRIRKVDTAGVITTIAGSGASGPFGRGGYSGDDGPATAAHLNSPADLAIAPDGTIYFADTQNSCIRKIDPSGTISRVAGQCSPDRLAESFSGDGGSPLEAQLDRPYGLHLDGDKLYIADSYNNRIRVVNLPR